MKVVNVGASSSYDVIIDKGLLEKTGEYLETKVRSKNAVIITDDIVDKLYYKKVYNSLVAGGYTVNKYVIKNGEQSKNSENYIKILNFLAKNRITRKDFLIALGGGVVGDLTGFVAGTYLRGIDFVQIPTTLLADVDSSVGGKTAIDLDEGKNLCGVFYQPKVVLCDYSTLTTLDDNVYRDGCAEVIKYGIIADRKLFDKLKKGVKSREEDVIQRCVFLKSDIVKKDEFDNGIRQLLNFGHTIGHAIEKCSDYTISHGSAVAIGMVMIAKASFNMGLCSKEDYKEVVDIVKMYNLPTSTSFDMESLLNVMLTDKKRAGESINLVVLKEIGKCELMKVSIEKMREIMINLG